MKLKFTTSALLLVLSLVPAAAPAQVVQNKQQEFAAHMQKAMGYLKQRQPKLAIPEFEAAVALDPESVDAQGNLGVLLFFDGKATEAVPHLRAALGLQPNLTKIHGLLGLAELQTSDAAQGRKDLEDVFPQIDDAKFKVQVGLQLVSVYTQSGELEQALPILTQLRKAAPDDPEVMYASYRTYSDLAGESMLGLALHAPDSAQMHQMLAHEETREGKTNAAITEYHKAIAIAPHLPGAHFELAELLHTSQDAAVKKEAEQEYHAALAENPRDDKVMCRLGEMDEQRGEMQKAADWYGKALAINPANTDAKLGLAKAMIELNQADKALPLLEQTVQDDPTNAIAHYRLAALYHKSGRLDDAKREIETYKQLKDLKEQLRGRFKDLMNVPAEIGADSAVEK